MLYPWLRDAKLLAKLIEIVPEAANVVHDSPHISLLFLLQLLNELLDVRFDFSRITRASPWWPSLSHTVLIDCSAWLMLSSSTTVRAAN